MAKVVRSNSQISRDVVSVLAAVLLTACARAAPELPPDYGSMRSSERLTKENFTTTDLKYSGSDIRKERSELAIAEEKYEFSIRSKRGGNQTAGYIAAVLFPPALLATKHSTEEKNALDKIQERRDILIALERFKNCSA